jgi:heat shock protein HslJ
MGAGAYRLALAALLCAGCTSIYADQRTFDGTRWHASAINGHATPPTGNYVMRFDQGGIGGQLGCNHFGGDYRVRDDTLTASAIQMTLMACPEPSATFENQGLAVLNQPMRMSWASSRKLTLSNAAGTIALELLP